MYVRIPLLMLSQRVISPSSMKIGSLRGSTGLTGFFSRLLVYLAETLEDISPEELRPIELALTELLISCLEWREGGFRAWWCRRS